MPRGDATRGAGLSTYYEPRLLSSRFFFSPRVSPPAVVFLPFAPFLRVPSLPLPFRSPSPSHSVPSPTDPTESPFGPRYFTAARPALSLLRVLYLLVFSGLVFIPNAASRMRTFVMYVCVCMCKYMHVTLARVHTRKRECVWPVLALMRTPPRMRGPPSGIAPSLFLSLSYRISVSPASSPRLLDSRERSRALKLRRQPNKLTRIVRARRTSPFGLLSLSLARSRYPSGLKRERRKEKKIEREGEKKKRSKGVLLNGRLGTERKETAFLGGHRFLLVNPLSPYNAITSYSIVLAVGLLIPRDIMPFCQRRVDKKGYTRRIPTPSKPNSYLAQVPPER